MVGDTESHEIAQCGCHAAAMNTYPYTLEIQPSERSPGAFEWTIRRNGKLIQRSDRLQRSEEAARRDGEKALERQFTDPGGR